MLTFSVSQFVYPILITWTITTATFPPFLGKYMAATVSRMKSHKYSCLIKYRLTPRGFYFESAWDTCDNQSLVQQSNLERGIVRFDLKEDTRRVDNTKHTLLSPSDSLYRNAILDIGFSVDHPNPEWSLHTCSQNGGCLR